MQAILILHGPNLNLLDSARPIYTARSAWRRSTGACARRARSWAWRCELPVEPRGRLDRRAA